MNSPSKKGRLAPVIASISPGHRAVVEQSAAEIESRFRWARKQGHIAYLWPDVPVRAWRACLHEIERVTQLMLADAHYPVDWVTPPGTDPRAAGIAAFTSGLGPLLGFWVEGGRLRAPEELALLLRLHLEHGRRRAERIAATLRSTLGIMQVEGLQATLVKSAHTAHEYFPEPGTRPAADIDLVLSPAQIPAASRILEKHGYALLKTRRHPYKTDWAPPGVPRTLRSIELTHADNPITVELHDSLDRDFFGVRTLRLSSLAASNLIPSPEIHPAASVLGQPLLTVYLAAHASEELHQLQLVRIVELVAVIRRDTQTGRLDWAAFSEALRATAASRFVYPAFELAEQLAPGILPEPVRSDIAAAATPRMRRVLESMSPATAQRLEGLSLDERFLWASGPFDTARRLFHMLWPTRGESAALPHIYLRRLTRLVRGRVTLRRK
jgi:hypothetical protein